jgi:undecaprenyl diphosphate synthase
MEMNNVTPKHVAIIPDGNRRWAKRKGLEPFQGHFAGFEAMRRLIPFLFRQGVEIVTLYAFSRDNFTRSKSEVDYLLGDLIGRALEDFTHEFHENEIRARFIGDISLLPQDQLRQQIDGIEQDTQSYSPKTLVIALAYSGRDEIVRAVQKIIAQGKESLSMDSISQNLDTSGLPDPDLVIRTAGEQRLSDFLTWQAGYAEYYFSPKYWPDFEEGDVLDALQFYSERVRKFGGDDSQVI